MAEAQVFQDTSCHPWSGHGLSARATRDLKPRAQWYLVAGEGLLVDLRENLKSLGTHYLIIHHLIWESPNFLEGFPSSHSGNVDCWLSGNIWKRCPPCCVDKVGRCGASGRTGAGRHQQRQRQGRPGYVTWRDPSGPFRRRMEGAALQQVSRGRARPTDPTSSFLVAHFLRPGSLESCLPPNLGETLYPICFQSQPSHTLNPIEPDWNNKLITFNFMKNSLIFFHPVHAETLFPLR